MVQETKVGPKTAPAPARTGISGLHTADGDSPRDGALGMGKV